MNKERYEMVKNMKNIKTGTYINYTTNESCNFNFATDLSAYRKMMFTNYVVNSVVGDERYDSIVKPLIFDFGLVAICTNIDTSFINQTDDKGNPINPIIFIEQFLEETNVVHIVKENMAIGLFEELNKAVDKSIEYRTGIHLNPIADSFASLISTLEKKINEVDLGNAMEMVQKFVNMTDEFTVDNVVNAYMNSDIHKNNLEEIAESKKNKKNGKSKKNEIKIDESLGEAIRTVAKENKVEKAEVIE